MENKAKGFSYVKTPYNYISYFKDGNWDEGIFRTDDTITIAATSTSLHYGQQAFEGLKAYRRKDGNINLFRVLDNAKRFQDSCERMMMPKIPLDVFVEAVKLAVFPEQMDVFELVGIFGTEDTSTVTAILLLLQPLSFALTK